MEDVFDVEESAVGCTLLVFLLLDSQTNITQININKSFGEPFRRFKSHYDDKGKQIGRCKTLD